MRKIQGWEVEIRVNGESVLTIGGGSAAHLAGDPEIDSDIVRTCAQHLLGFIGEPQSSIMQAADRAAKVIDGWSDAKREYAERMTASDSRPTRDSQSAVKDSSQHRSTEGG